MHGHLQDDNDNSDSQDKHHLQKFDCAIFLVPLILIMFYFNVI